MTTKVARLMLASDILHNSTAPVRNASRYRSLLESSLPDVFESLQVNYLSISAASPRVPSRDLASSPRQSCICTTQITRPSRFPARAFCQANLVQRRVPRSQGPSESCAKRFQYSPASEALPCRILTCLWRVVCTRRSCGAMSCACSGSGDPGSSSQMTSSMACRSVAA